MGAKLSKERRAFVEARAWELRLQGWTFAAIASELGLSAPAVFKAVERVEDRELARLSRRVEATKARQTAQLEGVIRRAVEGYDRSCSDAVTVKTTGEGEKAEVTTTVRGQAGDPRFLSEIRGALDDLRKLWGLNKAAPHDSDGLLRELLLKAAAYREDAPQDAPADADGAAP